MVLKDIGKANQPAFPQDTEIALDLMITTAEGRTNLAISSPSAHADLKQRNTFRHRVHTKKRSNMS